MSSPHLIPTLIDYHISITGRVWDSIDQISEAQFVGAAAYSRGSIRNLMVHVANPDFGWMTGIKNLPDERGSLKPYEAYANRGSGRAHWQSVAGELRDDASQLSDTAFNERPRDMLLKRSQVLLHLVNHGTDHRSTVLQRLMELGVATFEQDFSLWLAGREASD